MRRRGPRRDSGTEQPGDTQQLDFDQLLKGGNDEPLRTEGEATHMLQYCPHQYHAIEDKEAYFTEIGEEAERQVSSTYSKLSRPELGEKDLAARMMAEETVQELIYPTPPEQPRSRWTRTRRWPSVSRCNRTSGRRWIPTSRTARPCPARSGSQDRSANLAALRVLRQLQSEGRSATQSEQATLARWASWGAVPEVFDEANRRFGPIRAELHTLLSDKEWAAARRTTINAHYTSAEVVQAVWSAVADLGFAGGQVLEPGLWVGQLHRLRTPGCAITGVELDPATAGIAAALYPSATIRAESFADTALPDGDHGPGHRERPVRQDHTARPGPQRRSGTRSITTSSSRASTSPGPVGWWPWSPVDSPSTPRLTRPAGRWPSGPTCSVPSGSRPGTFRAASGTDVVTDVVLPAQARTRCTRVPASAWLSLSPVTTVDGEVPSTSTSPPTPR